MANLNITYSLQLITQILSLLLGHFRIFTHTKVFAARRGAPRHGARLLLQARLLRHELLDLLQVVDHVVLARGGRLLPPTRKQQVIVIVLESVAALRHLVVACRTLAWLIIGSHF